MIEDRPRHGGSYDLVPPGRMPIHVLAFGAVVTTQPARVLLATGLEGCRYRDPYFFSNFSVS